MNILLYHQLIFIPDLSIRLNNHKIMLSDFQASDVSSLAAQVDKLSNALVKLTGKVEYPTSLFSSRSNFIR